MIPFISGSSIIVISISSSSSRIPVCMGWVGERAYVVITFSTKRYLHMLFQTIIHDMKRWDLAKTCSADLLV